MAIKLKSVLRNPILPLAFKALIFSWFLYGFFIAGGFWWAAVVLGAAMIFYFKPLFNILVLRLSFGVLLVLALLMKADNFEWLAAIVFGALFLIILGLKNYVLIRRTVWYLILNFSLLYLAFLNFFMIDRSSFYILKWLGFVILIFFLFKELLRLLAFGWFGKTTIYSGLLALVVGELMWVVSWLPIGFLNSAALMMLVVLLMSDMTINYYLGTLKTKLIIKDFGLFLLLFLVVLLTARWRL